MAAAQPGDVPVAVAGVEGQNWAAPEAMVDSSDGSTLACLDGIDLHGLSPLLYACAVYDEELGERILKECSGKIDVNERDAHGYTPLHHAAAAGLAGLASALLVAGSDVNARTEDMSVQFGSFQSGGMTPLHLAAQEGNSEICTLLLASGVNVHACDFEGNTAAILAAMRRYRDLALRLLPPAAGELPSEADLQKKQALDNVQVQQRYALSMYPSGLLRKVHVLKHIWSEEECCRVLSAVKDTARNHGWHSARHVSYPTTDVRVSDLEDSTRRFVIGSVTERVLPRMAELYGFDVGRLRFRDFFCVKYSAEGQRGLDEHRDGSRLSFIMLINSPEEFEGGGTRFVELDQTVSGGRGDCCCFSGRLLHCGVPITQGERFIVAGFVHVAQLDNIDF